MGCSVVATRKDVAERAAVSPSTVSRVVNNNGYVAPEVRRRVERAIRDLEYVPNRIARSLRTQASMQIACVTHNITNPFYGEVVLGIEDEAFSNGYSFSLYNANFEQRDYPRVMQEGFHDGLIILSPVELSASTKLDIIKNAIPTVMYWDWGGQSPLPNINVDLNYAMQLAVSALIESGHTDIVYLGYEADAMDENPRFTGFQNAMRFHRVPINDDLVQLIPKWQDTLEMGYHKMKSFLSKKKTFTAVAASNDLLAIGAIRALRDEGYRVPEDISVTGVDDIELAHMIVPSLTTVRIPKATLGRALVQLWLANLASPQEWSRSLTSEVELIWRESARPRG